MIKFIILRLLFINFVESTISNNFYAYIQQQFGQEIANQLARTDLGELGSFGGGNLQFGTKTSRIPVIFVHGYMTSAKNTQAVADYFKQNYGYTDEELYGSSYGTRAIPQTAMHCEYVKSVRNLIRVVFGFTNSPVNVISYSMGSPIARKAILGGVCVDTNEQLGDPITSQINAYLSVGGANYGSLTCILPIYICNNINGMYCNSQFLNDINSKTRYEGQKIYALLSTEDDIVGYQACGKIASDIQGTDNTVTLHGLRHIGICSVQTAPNQYNLITNGTQ